MEGLLGSADLPDVGAEDALAVRALARAAWVDRVAQLMAIFAALGALALAVVAALGALVGAGNAGGRALQVLSAIAALVTAPAVMAWISAGIRRSQRETAREAMARADLAELRLHRVGVVLATRALGEGAFRDALLRLERDASAPSR
jgi:hypothetical protein